MESEKGKLVLVQQAMSVVYIVSINWLHCPLLSDSKVLLTVEQFWLLLDPNSKTTIWKHPSESEHLACFSNMNTCQLTNMNTSPYGRKGFGSKFWCRSTTYANYLQGVMVIYTNIMHVLSSLSLFYVYVIDLWNWNQSSKLLFLKLDIHTTN